MIITPQTITALFTGFHKIFQDALSTAETQWDQVATQVPSMTKSNTYGWLGKWPGFREWVGDRVFKNMKAQGYTVTNKKYESSVEVGRDEIEDDQIGIYGPMVMEMGQEAARFPDKLVFALLAAGFTTACYDGQNFFDAEHPVYPNVDGTGSAVPVANMQAGSGTPWFLLDTSRALKPLIYQLRRAPEFKAMTDSKDEAVFMRDSYRYGVDLRANAGFGFWQMAYGSKADLTLENYVAARTAMMSFTGDGDKKLKIMPKLLVVPPSLEAQALKILKAELIDGGNSNVYRHTAEVLCCPYL